LSKPLRPRFVALTELLSHHHPDVGVEAITAGQVLVDGRIITNPNARVPRDASLRVRPSRRLRGDIKLAHGLDALGVPVAGRVALDVGASAGGFTTALLDRGARRVYAVEAGVGQLVGRLRLHSAVVNLEGHNLGDLTTEVVPEVVELVVLDLSYLALALAIPQLEPLRLCPRADLMALVKPTFELKRGHLAAAPTELSHAFESVTTAAGRTGWTVRGTVVAPPTGRRGALEGFLHARRDGR
jgi:23S rRNA (cytidine1920-2'-O)/16S rRNA (cytidine1409-2'-O)-methyltransferase